MWFHFGSGSSLAKYLDSLILEANKSLIKCLINNVYIFWSQSRFKFFSNGHTFRLINIYELMLNWKNVTGKTLLFLFHCEIYEGTINSIYRINVHTHRIWTLR